MNNKRVSYSQHSAAAQGLAVCSVCHKLNEMSLGDCHRCGSALALRKPQPLQRTMALVVTALLLYIPANLLPIMTTFVLGSQSSNTIIGGVIVFWSHGDYPIASIIFIASVLVPVSKLLMLSWLCYSVARGKQASPSRRARLYRVTEFVGRWSMVDIFVVAVLVALVQLGNLMSISPGPAALAFSGVVIVTMLAAMSFDPRLIWDALENEQIDNEQGKHEPAQAQQGETINED